MNKEMIISQLKKGWRLNRFNGTKQWRLERFFRGEWMGQVVNTRSANAVAKIYGINQETYSMTVHAEVVK